MGYGNETVQYENRQLLSIIWIDRILLVELLGDNW